MEETDGGWNVRFKGYPDLYNYNTDELQGIEPPVLNSLAKPHPAKPQPSSPESGIKQKPKNKSPAILISEPDDAIENDHEGEAESLLHDLTVPESMANKPTTQPANLYRH